MQLMQLAYSGLHKIARPSSLHEHVSAPRGHRAIIVNLLCKPKGKFFLTLTFEYDIIIMGENLKTPGQRLPGKKGMRYHTP